MSDTKKILIIEDEKNLLEAIEKKFTIEGYSVFTALDGEAGLAQAKISKPDLILLDIVMPKMNGYEVLENLKKDKNLSKIPVIIISNSGQPVEIEKILTMGADDYLIKAEFDPSEVMIKVKDLLAKKENEEESIKNKTEVKEKLKKILIIEDDPMLLDLCVSKIKSTGFDIDASLDPQEGLEKIVKNKPDLIILDIVLPGIDGFEILKKIRTNSDKNIAKIPVIVLSNLSQESDIKKAMTLGANSYLLKASVTVNEIIREIKKVLSIF